MWVYILCLPQFDREIQGLFCALLNDQDEPFRFFEMLLIPYYHLL